MMDANTENMTQPWACGTPFVKLMTQIKDRRTSAKVGNNDMSDKRTVCIAFKLVTDTKQLDHAYAEWHNKVAANKYWTKFKKHFSNSHLAWKLTQTTGGDRFNKANNAEHAPEWDQQGTNSVMDELAPALAKLAEATSLNRQALENLAAAQASDCAESGWLHTELAATKKAI